MPTSGACSDRDIESLAAEARLGTISKTTVSAIFRDLRDRYRAFRAKGLGEVRLLALMLEAIYLPVRPDGPKEGVLVAWASAPRGSGSCSTSASGSGNGSRTGSTSDGAPGLIRAVTELWPDADRQRCSVHYAEPRIMPTRTIEAQAA